jgi:hypothetical protein
MENDGWRRVRVLIILLDILVDAKQNFLLENGEVHALVHMVSCPANQVIEESSLSSVPPIAKASAISPN